MEVQLEGACDEVQCTSNTIDLLSYIYVGMQFAGTVQCAALVLVMQFTGVVPLSSTEQQFHLNNVVIRFVNANKQLSASGHAVWCRRPVAV